MVWILAALSIYAFIVTCYCFYLILERNQLQEWSEIKAERMIEIEQRASQKITIEIPPIKEEHET